MTRFRFFIFRILYWLKYRKSTRKQLAEIVKEMDGLTNAQHQPITGREKTHAGFQLTRDVVMRKKKKRGRKAFRALEWAVQAEKGITHRSTHQKEAGLRLLYAKENRTQDKPWGLEHDSDVYTTTRLVRAVQKERAARASIVEKIVGKPSDDYLDTCAVCHWYFDETWTAEYHGSCQRRSPVFGDPPAGVRKFPKVQITDKCGDFDHMMFHKQKKKRK